MNNDKKAVGRPTSGKPDSERSKSETVSISPKDKAVILAKYGSLTNALRSLVKSKKK